jgi:hypothetical protein
MRKLLSWYQYRIILLFLEAPICETNYHSEKSSVDCVKLRIEAADTKRNKSFKIMTVFFAQHLTYMQVLNTCWVKSQLELVLLIFDFGSNCLNNSAFGNRAFLFYPLCVSLGMASEWEGVIYWQKHSTLYSVQIRKEFIYDLMRTKGFLSKEVWEHKWLISREREICKPVLKSGFYDPRQNGVPLRIWTQ